MSELEDRLNSILSSPDQMSKIMSLAQNFMNQNTENRQGQSAPKANSPAPDGLGLDPAALGMIGRLMGELNRTDSSKTNLIYSMKPFLKKEKQQRLDKALQITKLAHVAQVAMREYTGRDENV